LAENERKVIGVSQQINPKEKKKEGN